jgi:hypothetical protein
VSGRLHDESVERPDVRLEALLAEALDSGDDIPLTPEFWRGLNVVSQEVVDIEP